MPDKKPKNLNKQVRLTEDIASRVETVVQNSPFSEADVLRAAIEAGIGLLESGGYNPFAKKVIPAASMGLTLAGAM